MTRLAIPNLTSRNDQEFFGVLVDENENQLFTYSDYFLTEDIRKLANKFGFEVEYCPPNSLEYKIYGSQTMKVVKKKQKKLTKPDAIEIGRLLGYSEEFQEQKGCRFWSYLHGEIKNWNYDETIHYGDMIDTVIPIVLFLNERGYKLPKSTKYDKR